MCMVLGNVIRKWRICEERTLRSVSSDIGISLPTLQRLEMGEKCDGDTLAAVLMWLIGRTKK
jgi:hypothetical protein